MFTVQPINTMETNMEFVLKDINRVVDSLVKYINTLEAEKAELLKPVPKEKQWETLGGDLLQNFSAKAYRGGRFTDHGEVPNDSFYIYDVDDKPYFKDINGTSTALY